MFNYSIYNNSLYLIYIRSIDKKEIYNEISFTIDERCLLIRCLFIHIITEVITKRMGRFI